jgi:hypothetical protein
MLGRLQPGQAASIRNSIRRSVGAVLNRLRSRPRSTAGWSRSCDQCDRTFRMPGLEKRFDAGLRPDHGGRRVALGDDDWDLPRAWHDLGCIARGLKGHAEFSTGAQSAGGGRRPRVCCLANTLAVCGSAQHASTCWKRVWAVLQTARREGRGPTRGARWRVPPGLKSVWPFRPRTFATRSRSSFLTGAALTVREAWLPPRRARRRAGMRLSPG